MADPFRLRVMKALTAALEEISVENGYAHELAGKVFRGRIIFGERDVPPYLSILEVPIPADLLPSPRDAELQAGPWDLIVQGVVADDKKNPTDPAHLLLADVKKRLAFERRKTTEGTCLGIYEIRGLSIGAGSVRPPDEVSSKAYFWLAVALDMVENLTDPWA